ncbi:MAG TPA: ABC transporter substrate binding protein, partial [Candidatus Binatia bacterium]|nr:ABC transporter substrate binding protein [Candidatus Binatia bacterium]
GVLKALEKMPSGQIETYAENLDILRFPGESFQRILKEYLTAKYAARPPDLIILVYVGSLTLAVNLLHELFPGAPVIVAGATEEEVRVEHFRGPVAGVASRADPHATLELIFLLQPEIRRVVVIGGSAEVDRNVLKRVKEAARSFTPQVEFEFWENRSMAELERAVAALPRRTAILISRMFRDGAGQAVISTEAARSIAQWANVPVYVMTDTALGTGAVGGSVASIDAIGRRAGELARLFLSGAEPESLPLENDSGRVPIVDWRALKRWGISESRLPEGSIVQFKALSFWQLYKLYIIGAIAIIVIQAAVIAQLLLHRVRRRRAEADLRNSEENLRTLVETTSAVPWQADAQSWRFTYVGPQAVRLLGYPLEQWYQKDFWVSHLHPDDREFAIKTCASKSAKTADFAFEYRFVASSGNSVWVHDIVHCERRDGRPVQLRGFMLDITTRKQVEERLRESEGRLSLAASAANLAVWEWDVEHDEVWLDNKGRSFFGWEQSERINPARFIERLDPEDRERVRQTIDRSLEQGADYSAEYRILAADRSLRWIVSRGAVELGSGGKPSRMRGVAIDITARKQAEAELQRHRQELAHITRVSTMGELAASLAHELNQPLTAILSNAQAAQRFLSDQHAHVDEVKEILADIVQDDHRAGEVIRRMRALVRKEELQFNSLDLRDLVEEMLPLIHSDAVSRNIRLLLCFGTDLPRVQGDKIQLQQVFINLLLNAFDSMKSCPSEKREVRIQAEANRVGVMEISVSDCGTGVASDELGKLFEPFYTTKPHGLGLGLAICRSIIEAHAGILLAKNNPDRGATFYFTLPVEGEEGRVSREEGRGEYGEPERP